VSQVEAVGVEFGDSRSGKDDAGRVLGGEDVEGEEEGLAEGLERALAGISRDISTPSLGHVVLSTYSCESVVRRAGECD